jgi:hypothetical protein
MRAVRRKYSVQPGTVYIVVTGEIVPTIAWAAPLEKFVCNDSRELLH